MTTKKHEQYQKYQIESFKTLIQECIKQKLDVLFIVGNLFAVPQPRNEIIQIVNQQLQELSANKIHTIIIPGARDTPLYFTHDEPIHHIFEGIKTVSVLHPKTKKQAKTSTIKVPILQQNYNKTPSRLFGVPSPFQRPDTYNIDIRPSKKALNCMFISDLSAFKRDKDNIAKNLAKNLRKKGKNLDYVVIGGILPAELQKLGDEELPFELIHAPQVHLYDFEHIDDSHGLKIQNLELEDPNSQKNQESQSVKAETIPISTMKFARHELNVGGLPIDSINPEIDRIIKKNADLDKSMLRISLIGKLNREDYHNIQVFRFLEKGNRLNYYFELDDDVEFISETPDIAGFNVIKELELFVEDRIEDFSQMETVPNSEFSTEETMKLYKNALNRIKRDWKR